MDAASGTSPMLCGAARTERTAPARRHLVAASPGCAGRARFATWRLRVRCRAPQDDGFWGELEGPDGDNDDEGDEEDEDEEEEESEDGGRGYGVRTGAPGRRASGTPRPSRLHKGVPFWARGAPFVPRPAWWVETPTSPLVTPPCPAAHCVPCRAVPCRVAWRRQACWTRSAPPRPRWALWRPPAPPPSCPSWSPRGRRSPSSPAA
jgi:hypothetical protein